VDIDGRMTSPPGVDCDVTGSHQVPGDDVPHGCIYILEQRLTEDEAWSNMESVREEFYEEAVV